MKSNDLVQLFQLHTNQVITFIFGLVLLVLAVRVLNRFGSHISQRFPTRRLIVLQLITAITFLIYLLGIPLLIYTSIRPPKELMLAMGGSAAVAIGFSLKDLVASFVAGLILIFDRPFRVGDRVKFGDDYGDITSIGIRAVRLRTLDDSEVTIPNARFITDVVASANSGALDMMVTVDFHLALDADIDQAKALVYESVVTSRFIYLKKAVSIVVSEVEIAHRLALRMRVKAYVLDVHYEKAFETDIVTRVVRLFNKKDIKRPIL